MEKTIWSFLLLNIGILVVTFSKKPNELSFYSINSSPKIDSLDRRIYDSLKLLLKRTGELDQRYRNEMENVMAKNGGGSNQMQELFKVLSTTDSLNSNIVSNMLDSFGWLGVDKIGSDGVHTIFMVIQHSKLEMQKKYFPLLKEAVNRGELKSSSLALLVDRIAVKEGHKQIYGSQVAWDLKANTYKIVPIEDPDNLDKRRAEVGLGNMSNYVMSCCNIVWNIEAHKKENSDTTFQKEKN